MRKHIHTARDLVLPIIDFFYPPFRKLMNLQTFRYAVSGAANTALGYIVYYVSFKFILLGKGLDLGFLLIQNYTVALALSFCISFPFGFFLMKYVVFSDSYLRGRVQLFRYFLVYLINLGLNYAFLKITVEALHIYPTIAQLITISILILLSYLFQRHFTFRVDANKKNDDN